MRTRKKARLSYASTSDASAYFFGPGSEVGFEEVSRVLAPGGVFIAIDNSWTGGDFARLLRSATRGNASVDPAATDQWWDDRGAVRHDVLGQ